MSGHIHEIMVKYTARHCILNVNSQGVLGQVYISILKYLEDVYIKRAAFLIHKYFIIAN